MVAADHRLHWRRRRNLRVKVDSGVVRVVGGTQQTINYVISNHSYAASEEKARREFESYKISVSVRGDTAWVTGRMAGQQAAPLFQRIRYQRSRGI